MRTLLIIAAAFTGFLSAPSTASAFESTAVGVGSGVLAGAVVAGPIGAVVGGITGAYVGSRYERRRVVYRAHPRRRAAHRRPVRQVTHWRDRP